MKIAAVEEEYKKNEELRAEDISTLQQWILKTPHIPPIPELLLINFLHSCYWSMELAKATIEKFVTFKSAWPDFFANRNPLAPKLLYDLEFPLFTFLPTRTAEGYKVLYFKLMIDDSDRYDLQVTMKIMDMIIIMELMGKGTFDGILIVCDLTNFGVGHILRTNITDTKRILVYVQDALPVRLKSLHYLIPGKICEVLVPLIKPFIRKELLAQLKFHDSYNTLFKHVPRELFPMDIGGQAPSLSELHDNMKASLIANADFFEDDERFVSNEELRDRRPSYMDRDLGIGIDGSFKKLNFD